MTIPTHYRRLLCCLLALVVIGCGQPLASAPSPQPAATAALPTPLPSPVPAATPSHAPAATAAPSPTAVPTAAPSATPDPANDPVLVGAGDIASCASRGAAATAQLLDQIAGTVVTLGDNAYDAGTAAQFRDCYDPSWGRHKARTRPAPGNHDYGTRGAAAYFAYFGETAGPAGRGYYSYDLGAWHIVSLNSEIAAGPDSEQAAWLEQDLAANPRACTLAYWHRPLFSSGSVHGDDPHMRAIWDILERAGTDLVLNGHDHIYERFAPQSSDGQAGPGGMREFVVGVGGAELYGIGRIQPNSELRHTGDFGVLKLTLHATGYDWEFIAAGSPFRDTGSAQCH